MCERNKKRLGILTALYKSAKFRINNRSVMWERKHILYKEESYNYDTKEDVHTLPDCSCDWNSHHGCTACCQWTDH